MANAGFDAESFLKQLTTRPGVYQMYDSAGGLLYVGKAQEPKESCDQLFQGEWSLGKDDGPCGAHT